MIQIEVVALSGFEHNGRRKRDDRFHVSQQHAKELAARGLVSLATEAEFLQGSSKVPPKGLATLIADVQQAASKEMPRTGRRKGGKTEGKTEGPAPDGQAAAADTTVTGNQQTADTQASDKPTQGHASGADGNASGEAAGPTHQQTAGTDGAGVAPAAPAANAQAPGADAAAADAGKE